VLDISTANSEAFGDFLGKMQAAVAAGNPPDLAYQSNISNAQMDLLGLLEDVTGVVDEAVGRYGAIMRGTNAEANGKLNGAWKAVPFISNTTGYFARGDKLAEIGVEPADLVTWDQRRDACLQMSNADEEFWGWGLTPNQSGDGYGYLMLVINSFGGHFTDETGQIVQFDSPETLAAVEWLAETYNRDGMYGPMLPPGIESWTDISNNEVYLAGNIGYTHNAFSVYAQAKRDSNPVFPNTVLLRAPQGPSGMIHDGGGIGGWINIFSGAPNIDLAKQLTLALLDPANFNQMSSVAGGLFMPAYENLWTDELLAADPNFAVIKEQVSVESPWIGASWPAQPNAAIAAIQAASVPNQMMANIISGRMNPAEAVTDAHKQIVDIFEEGGIMQP
ncbi:MAG: ABC transporter substrate-binding protein, partial [Anaerolineae bacterium]|nr:ABC transporter substrate-binding protein [Anaerolineae bacterium]